jgi:hypothetical protein
MYKTILLTILLISVFIDAFADKVDSLSHWGVSVSGMPGQILALDHYTKKWLKTKNCFSFSTEFIHASLPSDSDSYASDYNYPTFSFGLRYAFNKKVRLHRDPDPDWGLLQTVNFDSHLGNTISLYSSFNRPFFRSRYFETDYTLGTGIAYSHLKYNKIDNPDDEFIGSRWLIYFTAGLHITWHFADKWGLKTGVDFYHHSNGALNRPNKGSNTLGPSLALVYMPYYNFISTKKGNSYNPPFDKYFYLNFTAGLGGKVLNEDWQKTQFGTSPSDPNYRTGRFHFYTAYSFQSDFMYRYARRWASGIGVDVFYGSYSWRVKQLDNEDGYDLPHSPWSAGIAAKHQVFYHNFSLTMSFGYYLYRHMGENAKIIEAPYYERIGVHYTFQSLRNIEIGMNVKAHKTKADFTEFTISVPVKL